MGRPQKSGLTFFSHDTDASTDEKIQGIEATHGDSGYAFYFKTLERIYKSDSDFIDLSTDWQEAVHAKFLGKTREELTSLINTSLEVGLFDKGTYEQSKHLTSNGISARRGFVNEYRKEERARVAERRSKEKQEQPDFLSQTGQLADKVRTTSGQLADKVRTTVIQLPEYIEQEAWDGFVEMRKKIKKPMTARAMQLCVADLGKLKALGINPNERLNKCVVHSWQGVIFDSDKQGGNGSHPVEASQEVENWS